MIQDILQKVARREPLSLLEQDIYNAWAKDQENVGARISELETKQQQIDGVVGSITPRAAPLTKVSQISNDLGDMIAGRFIAPASDATSTEPTNTGFSGAFVSGDGETFNGDEYHIGGVRNGLLQFGLNADDGKAYAGGGAVVLDEDGIVIPQGGDAIDFSDDIYSEHALLSFRTYPDSDASLLELYVYQLESEDNLISNGTFATGDLTDWTETDPGGKISVASTERGHSVLFATGASASEYLTQNLSATASNGMVVKLKAKSGAGTTLTVGNSTTYQRLYSPGLNEWRNYVFFIYVSSTDLKIYTDGAGDTYIDDIEVSALLITATTVPSVSSIRITPNTVTLAGSSSPTSGLAVGAGSVQVNPFGGDVDFKALGNTDNDLLSVDAGLDAIGIGGAAQSGKKLKVTGDVKLTTNIDFDEQAGDPATPATGDWKLYFKSGGLYHVDDAGAVTGPLGTGGGAVDSVNGDTGTVVVDYASVSGQDADTDVTGAELETLSDGSNADALHKHEYIFVFATYVDPNPISATNKFPYAGTVDRNLTMLEWTQAIYVSPAHDASNYYTMELYYRKPGVPSDVLLSTLTTQTATSGGANNLSTTTFSQSTITGDGYIYMKVTKTNSPSNTYIVVPALRVKAT